MIERQRENVRATSLDSDDAVPPMRYRAGRTCVDCGARISVYNSLSRCSLCLDKWCNHPTRPSQKERCVKPIRIRSEDPAVLRELRNKRIERMRKARTQ